MGNLDKELFVNLTVKKLSQMYKNYMTFPPQCKLKFAERSMNQG